jgi:lambda family phage tail tape measure protein
MADTQVRQININVKTSGDASIKSLKNQFKEMNTTLKDTSLNISSLKFSLQSIIGATFLGIGLRELGAMADGFQLLYDRLTVLAGGGGGAALAFEGITKAARETNSSIEAIATSYSRLSLALSDAGLNSGQVLTLTKLLQQTFRLSGSTLAESTASTIQLAQGLASGALRGQELRSVLEQNAVYGKLLADQMDTTRGNLMKFAEAGKITAEVAIKALINSTNKLNEDAAKLGITFEQSLVKAMDTFKIKIGEVNREFGLSSKFDKGLTALTNNLGNIAAVITGSLVAIAIPKLVAGIQAIQAAIAAGSFFTVPYILALSVAIGTLTTAIIYIGNNFEELKIKAAIATKGFADIGATVEETLFGIRVTTLKSLPIIGEMISAFNLLNKSKYDSVDGLAKAQKDLKRLQGLKVDIADLRKSEDESAFGDFKVVTPKKILTLKQQLELLNASFNEGGILVGEYNKKLLELTEKMNIKKGATAYHDSVQKIKEANLNREFEYGLITITKYEEALKSMKIEELTYKVNAGRISLAEYHKEMNAISDKFMAGSAVYQGINDYITSSGTLAQNIAGNITLVFNSLEDVLFNFTKTGVFRFHEMTKAILDDLTRIIIRASIIQPLASGILGAMTPNNSGDKNSPNFIGPRQPQALGGGWSHGTQFFANGGIVDRATGFGMSGGRRGVMGEAGPEAILPLSRGPGGKLGVSGGGSSTTVNIINNTGAEISQSESTGSGGEKILDIIIANKTKELFASGGMDRTMRQVYGVSRRGN